MPHCKYSITAGGRPWALPGGLYEKQPLQQALQKQMRGKTEVQDVLFPQSRNTPASDRPSWKGSERLKDYAGPVQGWGKGGPSPAPVGVAPPFPPQSHGEPGSWWVAPGASPLHGSVAATGDKSPRPRGPELLPLGEYQSHKKSWRSPFP